ncbi:hypothetical protein [Anabaena lutea]|uniref:Uncharacterized protein n=1 Tax=Anabaena lutea FACHB-196 TaxID=2692881 RepID=A0ABR8FB95_9NOST|nr:hypothetical protein [Anabaena lutea]MBD2567135.1 hypothetical protein [Anabaena lutea FACHB-196]
MFQDLPIKHQDDPLVRDIDLVFQKLISEIALAFEQVVKQDGMRATHSFFVSRLKTVNDRIFYKSSYEEFNRLLSAMNELKIAQYFGMK